MAINDPRPSGPGTSRPAQVTTATPPRREADVPDVTHTEDIAQLAATKKGKDPAELSGAELIEAAVKGELSTDLAPVRPVRQPIDAHDDAPLAQNGLPYANVDEQFHNNWDLIEGRNAEIEKAAKDS